MSFAVTPLGVPSRTVRVEFSPGSPEVPRVFTDGPQESPHRYADGSLCMWYPRDPIDLQWAQARRRGGAHRLHRFAPDPRAVVARDRRMARPGGAAPRTADAPAKDRRVTAIPARTPISTLTPARAPTAAR